ncbi:GNAT family N-acetyltransferase [Niveibacterium sp. SC-1]|uniref:3'-5' exonuclease n=1 Tax=Niveibacterium sp. SC-1 TaxID=3135646 RepID=UPI00311F3ECF
MDAPALDLNQLPIILDIEASGLGAGSYPIEIGVALPDGESYCSLVRPEPDWQHWDADAEATHGIPREVPTSRGRPAAEVADALNRLLGGKVAYSDGWSNDYSWLSLLFDAARCVPRFRLDNLRALLSEDEAARWHATKDEVIAELRPVRHRASSDARVLQITVARVKQGPRGAGEDPGQETRLLEDMAELDVLTLGDVIRALHGRCDRAMQRERHATALACGARVLAEHLEHQLAGYVMLRDASKGVCEILAANLHPWYRRTGLYRRLLTRLLAHLLSHNCHTLTSLVLPGNEISKDLHERLGFALERSDPLQLRYTIRTADLAQRMRQL